MRLNSMHHLKENMYVTQTHSQGQCEVFPDNAGHMVSMAYTAATGLCPRKDSYSVQSQRTISPDASPPEGVPMTVYFEHSVADSHQAEIGRYLSEITRERRKT
ncbi:hypothetical protein IHE44_0002753 [Lamprotornis superbus]|uniref:Uncharacterized protein n=1 Tax=Lamprotornis superbus TaxID=245042 RepID=A0A835U2D8_9PASS|nr:hypothetical protein IHE44_0002753 [Lamprotornis superbus]